MSNYIYTNGNLRNTDELMHYGVLGMKWGKRKARPPITNSTNVAAARTHMLQARAKKRTSGAAYTKAYNDATSVKNWFGEKNKAASAEFTRTAKAANNADAEYKNAKKTLKQVKRNAKVEQKAKQIADKKLQKMQKEAYKDTIKKYAKEINAGESTVGRLYNKLTGADKIQAELRYDMEKRAKVNKAWRD